MGQDPQPLSDDERQELAALLERGGERALAVEAVDGLFAALICAPGVAKPGEWMPVIWGGEMPEWESVDALRRFLDLVMRHWNDVAASINDGTFAPLVTTARDPSGREVVLAHHWCMGFMEGMQMRGAQWFGHADDELRQLLHPIEVLYAHALLILSKSSPERVKRLTSDELNRLADAIPDAVVELRAYWREHPAAAEPASTPQVTRVGRNEPCPCGSGRKFKHCCGSGASARPPEQKRGASPQPYAQAAPVREKGTWIAGLAELPAFVEGEGRPYRPVVALILDAEGSVRGTSLNRPGDRKAAMAGAVRQARNDPMAGVPGRPHRVVVPTPDLVAVVGSLLPGVEVVVGPAPELEEALESLRDHFRAPDREGAAQTYLTADSTPEGLSAFFDAAAELYERAPWTVVPDDESLFRITSSGLGIRGAVACVIGQIKESYGVILFNSSDDCAHYRRLAGLAAAGSMPKRGFPRHASLNFERAKDIEPAMRKEISTRKWRVAGPAAFPRIMLVEPDGLLRPPTRDDYRRMEGVCRAISRLIDTEAGLSLAWESGRRVRRRVTVDVEGAPVSVSISVE